MMFMELPNNEYTLSPVFNKYKNNKEDYEIVLEKYITKSSTQSLVDFYLVNTKTLEITEQQRGRIKNFS